MAAAFETGVGRDARAYLNFLAGETVLLGTEAGESGRAQVSVPAEAGCASAASLDVVAAPDSTLALDVVLDGTDDFGAEDAPALIGAALRVFAGARARVTVTVYVTALPGTVVIDDEGYVLDEGARVTVRHVVLGGGATYTGMACDLRCDTARVDIDTSYLAAGAERRDFAYTVRHRGRKTISNILANGVLAGTSKKVLRGTIDLVHGCKGSEGTERETVLLASEGVDNKTVPTILCDEDDVAGNHGATIGHVRPDQLFYLTCRGISPAEAEALFLRAKLEDARSPHPPTTRAPPSAVWRGAWSTILRRSSYDRYRARNLRHLHRAGRARARRVDEASRAWPVTDIAANPYKADFPLLAGRPDLAFLDSAATAQRPACALDAQRRFYETMNANPLRGLYELSVEATEAIARVRDRVAALIGAVDEGGRPRAHEIVFTRNTSESLNLVAKAFAPTVLRPGDEVAITIMEHHSNLNPLAADVPRRRRHPRLPLPHQDGRAHGRGDRREDRPAHQDRRRHAGVERLRLPRPHREARPGGARPRRLHGRRRGAVRPPHARRCARARGGLPRVLRPQGARAHGRRRALGPLGAPRPLRALSSPAAR